MKQKKGEIWVSVILYTLIAAMALVIIIQGGVPILNRIRERAAYSQMKDVMVSFDKQITELMHEGEGSQRLVSVDMKEGKLKIQDNSIRWEYYTDDEIVAPRTSVTMGNLIITSNSNVRAVDNGTYYYMQNYIGNDSFSIKIRRYGSRENQVRINTSDLISYISYNGDRMDGKFNFSLSNDVLSTYGTGYTELIPPGNSTNLGMAKVVTHMNTSMGQYDLEIGMESYADYVVAKVRNFKPI